jgi:hypothetical protein
MGLTSVVVGASLLAPGLAGAQTAYTAPTKDTIFTGVQTGFSGTSDLVAAIAVAVLGGVALVALAKKGPKLIKWAIGKLV